MKKSNNISICFSKILLSIILFLSSLIYINKTDNTQLFKKYIFERNIKFNKFNKIFNKYISNNLIINKEDKDTMVFDEVNSESKEAFLNGTKLNRNQIGPVLTCQSGVLVFDGKKEDYGQTIIIQGIDGYDIWYSGIDNSSLKLYDYVEKGTIIGESSNPIITIVKGNEFISYDEYISQI